MLKFIKFLLIFLYLTIVACSYDPEVCIYMLNYYQVKKCSTSQWNAMSVSYNPRDFCDPDYPCHQLYPTDYACSTDLMVRNSGMGTTPWKICATDHCIGYDTENSSITYCINISSLVN